MSPNKCFTLALDQGIKHQLGAGRIGDVGGRQVHREQTPIGVDGDMPLSPIDLLVGVIAALTRAPRGIDWL